ncbi:MAG TPA: hypothetical protein VFI03_13320 [Solirubrobacterales bacterium]|nr:hypothetical protein [Solirubrobacterales bacterium]
MPWDSSSRKLKRAAKHYKSLNDELRSYIREGRPFEYQAEIDREEAQFRIRVVGGEPPPDEMSLIVGDFVQNLRASLDHLIWAAVRATGNTPTMGNAFPIFLEGPQTSRRKEALWARQLAGIAEEAIPLIDQIQPYKRGEDARFDALACLKELSNEDKHRVVLQTLNAIPDPNDAAPDLDFEYLDVEPIESYQLHAMKPLANGDLVMEAAIKITGPEPNIRIKGELPVEVAFGEFRIPASGLAMMFDRIDVVVAHLANELLGANLGPQPLGARLGEPPADAATTAPPDEPTDS